MAANPVRHALSRLGGRDSHQEHRAGTPRELFFDLTLPVAVLIDDIAAR